MTVNDIRLKGDLNVASVDLVSGKYRQTGSDIGPETTEFNFIGKKGQYQIKQGVGIPFAGYEHSFVTEGDGHIEGTETHEVSVGYASADSQGQVRLKLGGQFAFLLGIKGSVEFGFRPKSK